MIGWMLIAGGELAARVHKDLNLMKRLGYWVVLLSVPVICLVLLGTASASAEAAIAPPRDNYPYQPGYDACRPHELLRLRARDDAEY